MCFSVASSFAILACFLVGNVSAQVCIAFTAPRGFEDFDDLI
jgi:hypothetical protein